MIVARTIYICISERFSTIVSTLLTREDTFGYISGFTVSGLSYGVQGNGYSSVPNHDLE
jgi:hypothetical protein